MTSVADARPSSIFYPNGIRPELYTVASGSYGSNMTYGSGATPLLSYNANERPFGESYTFSSVTLASNTGAIYRKFDDKVFFNLTIDLDTKSVIPLGSISTGTELRIRCLSPLLTIGNNNVLGGTNPSNRSIPIGSLNFTSPVFKETQIYSLNTVGGNVVWQPVSFSTILPFGISTGIAMSIRSRLLSDDTIAMYITTLQPQTPVTVTTPTDIPLTYEVFNEAIGFSMSNPVGSTSRITIKGYYTCS